MKSFFIQLGIMIVTAVIFMIMIETIPPEVIMENSTLIYLFFFIIILAMSFLPKIIAKLKVNYKDYVTLENIPQDFEEIYENLYNNHIKSLESMRKQVRCRTVIQYIAFVMITIALFFGESDYVIISEKFDNNIVIIGLISMAIYLIIFSKNRKYKKKYEETYKKEIVSNFIKLINNQLEYKPLAVEIKRIQDDYKIANFENKTFNRFYTDDYIEGFVNDETFFKMADLHIQNHTGSGRNSHTEEIYQGIFAYTRGKKDIGTYIKISKDKLKVLASQDRVEMDSEEFEKYFDVYSENKIVAMQLLTSEIMVTLIGFYNKYKLDFEIVFRNNSIYVRFFTGPMFEPRIFGSSMDKQLLFTYFCILRFCIEITEKVNKVVQEIEV